ncbi:MAG: DNA polymerase Y family protein, partial [Frankia sp.]
MTPPVRTLAVWVPDWPLVAARVDPGNIAAVLRAGRVWACTRAARVAGVVVGLRRRDAQSRCPELQLVPDDPARDARIFEPVIAAVETVVPGVEVMRPGLCVVPSRGGARYFGGDDQLTDRVREMVRSRTEVVCRTGIAGGPFAAVLAARGDPVVPSAGPPAVVAPMPVALLGRPALAELLRRRGLTTLGDVARLPAPDMLARFGPDGAHAHRLAHGRDGRSPAARVPPPELAVSCELDPPADRVELAVFAAKNLAEQVYDRLVDANLACTRILIEAQTEHGEQFGRVWRHDGPLTAAAIAERVRWQLDGWLAGTAPDVRPTAGVTRLRIVPEEVVTAAGRQLGLWGDAGTAAARVTRALARVQGLLGPDAVMTAEVVGGRGPAERVRLVPWGEPRTDFRSSVSGPRGLGPGDSVARDSEPGGSEAGGSGPGSGARGSGLGGSGAGDFGAGGFGSSRGGPDRASHVRNGPDAMPWPGCLPGPAPATVLPDPRPAVLSDASGAPVGVTGRCAVTAPPARLVVAGG